MALRYRAAEQSDRRRNAAVAVMRWVNGILDAADDVVVSVSGHQCGDPECTGSETTILLMRPDQPTQAIRIRKPLGTIKQADVVDALRSIRTAGRAICVR